MQQADEIIIECSRTQAVCSNGSASWRNQFPDIILEVGDKINCLGGFINTENAGDEAIEIYDPRQVDATEVDATFYFSYYKDMDCEAVTFPYHSSVFEDGERVRGSETGFTVVLEPEFQPDGVTANPNFNRSLPWVNQPFITNDGTNGGGEFTYAGGPASVGSTLVNTYENILHTPNSESYDTNIYSSYSNFLQNISNDNSSLFKKYPQGYRDLSNTTNRYTLIYNYTDGTNIYYKLVEREVELKIPAGYYSPEELSNFITEKMNTTYFNDRVAGTPLSENWSNNARFFKAMTPVAVPNLNLTAGGAWQPWGGDLDTAPPIGTGFLVESRSSPIWNCINWNRTVLGIDWWLTGTAEIAPMGNNTITGLPAPMTINSMTNYQQNGSWPVSFDTVSWWNGQTTPIGANLTDTNNPNIHASGASFQLNIQLTSLLQVGGTSGQINEVFPMLVSGEVTPTSDLQLMQIKYLKYMLDEFTGTNCRHQRNSKYPSTTQIDFGAGAPSPTTQLTGYQNNFFYSAGANWLQQDNNGGSAPFTTGNNAVPQEFSLGSFPIFNIHVGVMQESWSRGGYPEYFPIPTQTEGINNWTGFGLWNGDNVTDYGSGIDYGDGSIVDNGNGKWTFTNIALTWMYAESFYSSLGPPISQRFVPDDMPAGDGINKPSMNMWFSVGGQLYNEMFGQCQVSSGSPPTTHAQSTLYNTAGSQQIFLNQGLAECSTTDTNYIAFLNFSPGHPFPVPSPINNGYLIGGMAAGNRDFRWSPYNSLLITTLPVSAPMFIGFNELASAIPVSSTGGYCSGPGSAGYAELGLSSPAGRRYIYSDNPFTWNTFTKAKAVEPGVGNQGRSGLDDLFLWQSNNLNVGVRSDWPVGDDRIGQENPNSQLDAEKGNRQLGTTSMNHNRWSLWNYEVPDPTSDQKSPELMPMLRKFPLWSAAGTYLNRYDAYNEDDMVTGLGGGEYYPDNVNMMPVSRLTSVVFSNVTFSPIDQLGNRIFEQPSPTTLSGAYLERAKDWYNFIKSQIQDGLIDPTIDGEQTHPTTGRGYFVAYSHVAIEIFSTAAGTTYPLPDPPRITGSDNNQSERPRALLICVDWDSYYNYTAPTVAELTALTTDDYVYAYGMLLRNTTTGMADEPFVILGAWTYSWVYDRILTSSGGNSTGNYTSNFGFQDFNFTAEDPAGPQADKFQIDLTGDLIDGHSQGTNTSSIICWGYSPSKMGWRNFTGMLIDYNETNSGISAQYLFTPNINRQNPIVGDYGNRPFSGRILIGGRSPALTYDAGNSNRFFFDEFCSPRQLGNKFYQGYNNEDNELNLQPTTELPFMNVFLDFKDGYTLVDTPGTNDPISNTVMDIDLNANAGVDVLQYNMEKQDIYDDGLFQLAPEMTKHLPFDYMNGSGYNGEGLNSATQSLVASLDRGMFMYDPASLAVKFGNCITGLDFNYLHCMDDSLEYRFFCFDQDVRYNTYQNGTETYTQITDPPGVATGYNIYSGINDTISGQNIVAPQDAIQFIPPGYYNNGASLIAVVNPLLALAWDAATYGAVTLANPSADTWTFDVGLIGCIPQAGDTFLSGTNFFSSGTLGSYPIGSSTLNTEAVLNDFDTQNMIVQNRTTGINTVDESYYPTVNGIYTNFFWGAASGNEGWIKYEHPNNHLLNTPRYEAGTLRPDPTLVYDQKCGVQIYDWGTTTRANFDTSFWKIIGFTQEDIIPTPYIYCNQTRNFSTNFLTPYISGLAHYDTDVLNTQSYPMRSDVELLSTGFEPVNSTFTNALQYKLGFPRTKIISNEGVIGVDPKGGRYYIGIGGYYNEYSNNSYPKLVAFDFNNTILPKLPFPILPPPTFAVSQDYAVVTSTNGPINAQCYVVTDFDEAGPSLINGQLIQNDFTILNDTSGLDWGTRVYSSNVPSKIANPFYLIKSNIASPAQSGSYTNNAVVPAVFNICGMILLQYGVTNQYYWSTDASTLTFTNRTKRVLNSVDIEIVDNSGNLANTLENKSTILFKVTRAPIDPETPRIAIAQNRTGLGASDADVQDEINSTKEGVKEYDEEIDDLLNQDAIHTELE